MTIIIIIVAIVLLFGLYLFTRKSKLKDQELTKNSLAEKNGYSSSIQGEYYYNTEQGKLSYKNGTYNEALIYFENAFKLIPEPLVVIQLAGCNLKLGNIEKALGLCTEVINREPDFIDAYSTRIQCYIKLKHNKHAIKDLNILINIHSAEKNIYLKLISELEQGIIESDELGSDVLEVDEIFRLNGIAIELRKSKRYPEAIDIYQILISQVHSELLYTELIQTNIEMKNYQNALGMCKKGFEIFGDAPHLLKTRAYLNIYINNFEQAKNDYKTLSAMFPLFGQQLKDENFIEYLEKMKMEYEMKKFEETMDFEED